MIASVWIITKEGKIEIIKTTIPEAHNIFAKMVFGQNMTVAVFVNGKRMMCSSRIKNKLINV